MILIWKEDCIINGFSQLLEAVTRLELERRGPLQDFIESVVVLGVEDLLGLGDPVGVKLAESFHFLLRDDYG